MKLLEIKNGQCIRFMGVTPETQGGLYGINLVRAFEARYGFLEGPRTLDQFNIHNGVTFKHGIFQRKYVIDKAMIYNNGFLAEGSIPTDACYDFISDIIEWAAKEAGIVVSPEEDKPILYSSTVNIELDINMEKHLYLVNPIGEAISQKLSQYGSSFPQFEPAGILLWSSVVTQGPSPFRLERLAGAPFELNHYFSTCPLRTQDHLEILETVESVFKA
jgi:hypothetical protein